MKNNLLIVAALLVAKTATAQEDNTKTVTEPEDSTTIILKEEKPMKIINKGTWLLVGSFAIGFGDANETSDNITIDQNAFKYSVNPKIGYAISKNWVTGIGLGFGKSKNDTSTFNEGTVITNTERISNFYFINPYIRRYFNITKNFLIFIEGEGRYIHGENSSKTNNNITPDTSNDFLTEEIFSLGIRPGISLFLNNNFALEANLGFIGYQSLTLTEDRYESEKKTKLQEFVASLNSTFSFGVAYYF